MNKLVVNLRRLSLFLWITLLALGLGIILVFVDVLRSGHVLLSFGLLFVAIAFAAIVYKSHTAAAEVKRLQSQIIQLRRQVSDKKPKPKNTSKPASHRAANLPENRIMRALARSESRLRLRSIGLYKPQVVDPSAKGRQAAAVEPDTLRDYRLYAAVTGTLTSNMHHENLEPKRKIAVIGTEALTNRLQDDFNVVALHPGTAVAQFDAETPTGIIIEETALHSGPWSPALSASGTAILKEILGVRDKAVASALQVYVIPSGTIDVSTRVLRERATVVVDRIYSQEFVDTRSQIEDYESTGSVISSLVKYLRK